MVLWCANHGLAWKLMPSTPAAPYERAPRDRPGQRSLRRLAPRRSTCSLTPRERYGADGIVKVVLEMPKYGI
jgi:hypothetical protein